MVKLQLLSLLLAGVVNVSSAQNWLMKWDSKTTCGKVNYKEDILKKWPKKEDPGGDDVSIPRNIGKCARECRLMGKAKCKGFVFYYNGKTCLLFKVVKDESLRKTSDTAACGKWVRDVPVTPAPTPEPTPKPTPKPTRKPSTPKPTRKPSTPKPTRKPSTPKPTVKLTSKPTDKPTNLPTKGTTPKFKKYGDNENCKMDVLLKFGESANEMKSYGYHNDYLVVTKVKKAKENKYCCYELGAAKTFWGCQHTGDAAIYNLRGNYYDEISEESATVDNVTKQTFLVDARHWFNEYEAAFPGSKGYEDHIFPAKMSFKINNIDALTVSHVVNKNVDTHLYHLSDEGTENPSYKSNVRVKVKCLNKCRCVFRAYYNIPRTKDKCD
eukprot:CAMPEP_0184871474 /NCGR_PEP_ID=MMETSP0580-20130426/40739_1 /TAXON_ID=1118495 /ORGANISM="Dactyliosolen fragilissimus" /LENGTH=380 /DNA_ID=CAMNT_0027374137 /DNA_START=55 /DNA_END=1197 /DNA_ORIENTATION=+